MASCYISFAKTQNKPKHSILKTGEILSITIFSSSTSYPFHNTLRRLNIIQ